MKIKKNIQSLGFSVAFSFAVLCIAAIFPCAAQQMPQRVVDLKAKPSKNSNSSYLDLLRRVFPDARIDPDDATTAVAANSIPLRFLFGDGEKRFEGSERLSLDIAQRLETLDERGRVLWLLISVARAAKPDCDECSEKILAAFRFSADNAELIEAADVLTGFDAGFDGERPVLKIARNREAIVLWNFAYTYLEGDAFSVITIDGQNGFKTLIRQFGVGRYYRWDCDKWYEEEARLALAKTARGGFRDIEVSIETRGGTGEYDFPKPKTARHFRYVFAWQPRTQKYEASVNPDARRRALVKSIAPACPEGNRAVPINPQ